MVLVDSVDTLHNLVPPAYRPTLTPYSVAPRVDKHTVFLVGLYRIVVVAGYHAVPILYGGQALAGLARGQQTQP